MLATVDQCQISAALRGPVVVVVVGDVDEPLVSMLGRRTERFESGTVTLDDRDRPVVRRRRFNAPVLNHPGEVVGAPRAGDPDAHRPIGKAI
jgi:hypothetical protein